MMDTAEQRRPDRHRGVADRVLGATGAAMVVAALWLLLFGGPGDQVTESAAEPPMLSILSPAAGDTVFAPLPIHFASDRTLAPHSDGWGADGFHVHAEIAGREVMPGPADIRRLGEGRYEWVVPGIPSGTVELRLVWSDERHGRVAANATKGVSIFVR